MNNDHNGNKKNNDNNCQARDCQTKDVKSRSNKGDEIRVLADLAAGIAGGEPGKLYLAACADTPSDTTHFTRMEEWRLIFCTSGSRHHHFLNATSIKTIKLAAGDGVLVRPGVWLETWYEESGEALSIVLSDSVFRILYLSCRVGRSQKRVNRGVPVYAVDKGFDDPLSSEQQSNLGLIIALLSRDSISEDQYRTAAAQIILRIIQDILIRMKQDSHPVGKSAWTWRRVERYLRENNHLALTRDIVADDLQMHPNHLSRLFKEHGTTFSRYMNRLRMNKAREYLKTHPSSTVAGIASMCGYNDTGYFYRVFHSFFGLTPQQFRNRRISDHEDP